MVISILALAAVSTLGFVPVAHAAPPSIVGDASNACASCNSLSGTVNVPSGDAVVVGVALFPDTTITVSDGLSSVYSPAQTQSVGVPSLGEGLVEILTATPTGSGSDTVTAAFTSSVSASLYVFVVSGVTTSGLVGSAGTGSVCTTAGCTQDYSTSSVPITSGSLLFAVVQDRTSFSFIATLVGDFLGFYGAGDSLGDLAASAPTSGSSTTFLVGNNLDSGAGGYWGEVGIALAPTQTTVSTPQFPLGLTLLFALMVPALLALRKKVVSPIPRV